MAAQGQANQGQAVEEQLAGDKHPAADLAALTHADFAARLHEIFHLGLEAPVEGKLVSVAPWGPQRATRQPFTLTFQGPPEPVLPQRIHAVHNAGLGRLEIFLVPVGLDEAGMKYEAVFS